MRAVLVLVHIVAIVVGAFPVLVDERGMKKEAWAHPLVEAEFANVSQQLERLGVPRDPEEVKQMAWDTSLRWNRTLATLRSPFQFYYAEAGTRQRWRMFPAPVLQPVTFSIEREQEGEWRPVFLQRDAETQWRAKLLQHDRFRASFNLYYWTAPLDPDMESAYQEVIHWIATEVRNDFGPGRVRVLWRELPEWKKDDRVSTTPFAVTEMVREDVLAEETP
jgi:hypothetical protein